MGVPWGLVTIVVGILYGWLSPGRQQRMQLFKTGLLIGVVLGLALALLGYFYGANPLGLGVGFLDILISVVVLTLLFILGTWIGDLLERATKRGRS